MLTEAEKKLDPEIFYRAAELLKEPSNYRILASKQSSCCSCWAINEATESKHEGHSYVDTCPYHIFFDSLFGPTSEDMSELTKYRESGGKTAPPIYNCTAWWYGGLMTKESQDARVLALLTCYVLLGGEL